MQYFKAQMLNNLFSMNNSVRTVLMNDPASTEASIVHKYVPNCLCKQMSGDVILNSSAIWFWWYKTVNIRS